jgi:hypothetical protein
MKTFLKMMRDLDNSAWGDLIAVICLFVGGYGLWVIGAMVSP